VLFPDGSMRVLVRAAIDGSADDEVVLVFLVQLSCVVADGRLRNHGLPRRVRVRRGWARGGV
jgi:hypothetical protein